MPRSYQAYPQNAVVTHSPANTGTGDTSSAMSGAADAFKIPPGFDVCAPATTGTRNPFISGLNTMGGDTGNSTGVAGQTGNIMSGLQIFSDTMCGQALGGTSARAAIEAWRQIRERNGDPRETYRAMRQLRDVAGAGTTPQSVIAGVQSVTGVVNTNPVAKGAIATGRSSIGPSGNQAIDSINGAQTMANQSHSMLTGQPATGASGNDLLTAGGKTINQNTANHAGNQSLTAAQSVSLKQQNLLVSQDFHAASTVVGDVHWAWDGTDGAPSTGVLGCAKVTCNGQQKPLLSSEIPVVAGETIEVSCEIKWSGLSYGGGKSPIVLAVEKYRLMKDPAGSGQNMYSDVGWYAVYTPPNPGGTSNGWKGVAGTYVVEPGVDQVRFRLEVLPNATAGTVKWDDAEFLKLDLIPAEAVPGLTDNIVTQLYGTQGAGFTANQAAVALANTADSLTSVTSRVAALSAQGSTGSIAGDDFLWTGKLTANANWAGTYTTAFGYYAADGTDLVWSGSATGYNAITQVGLFAWVGTDATSLTDYQLVQLVLDSSPTAPSGMTAHTRVVGRMNTARTSYTVADIGSDGSWFVGYVSGGSLVKLKSGTGIAVPGLGSSISLYLGNKSTSAPRHYRLEVGTAMIADFDETGTGSPLGSSNRGWGLGVTTDSNFYTGAYGPKINQWLAQDQ